MLCIEKNKTGRTKRRNEGMCVVGFTGSADRPALRISPGVVVSLRTAGSMWIIKVCWAP